MTNKNFIKELSQRLDCTTREAQDMVHSLIDVMNEEFMAGEPFMIPGFGTFEVSERAARTGRNPRTGTEIEIEAAKAPKFKAGRAFKDAIQ